ncbi:MAG TPA: MFS transporter, partial [Pseudonocardiaceae bacterium]|nr:MFS transporter [Pseudonocardiaceae bacterium]
MPLIVFGCPGALAYLVENAWQSWGAVHMETTLNASAGLSSTAPAVFASAAASGRFAGNALARRFDPVRLLSAGALMAGVGTLVAATADTPWIGLVGIAVAGLGTSVCAPTVISLAGAWAGPERRGAAVSTVTTVAYVGFLVGPGRSGAGVVADVPTHGPDRGGRGREAVSRRVEHGSHRAIGEQAIGEQVNGHLTGPGRPSSQRPAQPPVGTVGWGLIGAGGIATDSVGPALHTVAGSLVRAAASTDMARTRALGAEIACSSYEQVRQDPQVDVVYVSLHNSAHMKWCADALSAGKHVLCEKPLAMTASEVADMADLAASTGKLLVEAMWVRWHPRMRELRGILGHVAPAGVRRVDIVFEGPEPSPGNYRLAPVLGGGALLDLGCYAMAAVLEVFDWEIPTVLGAELRRGPGGADASTRAELQFAGGTVSVHVALTGCGDQRLRIDAGPQPRRSHPPASELA